MKCDACQGELKYTKSVNWMECVDCHEQYDMCNYCRERPLDIDDEGLMICNKCYKEKKHIRPECDDCGVQHPTVTDTRWGKKLCMNCSYRYINNERHSEGYTPFGDE